MRSVQSIIQELEAGIAELRAALEMETGGLGMARRRERGKRGAPANERNGLRGNILNLVDEGFFEKPRRIGEIQGRLRDLGIKKPLTTLQGPLLILIREKKLERQKSGEGKYIYFSPKSKPERKDVR